MSDISDVVNEPVKTNSIEEPLSDHPFDDPNHWAVKAALSKPAYVASGAVKCLGIGSYLHVAGYANPIIALGGIAAFFGGMLQKYIFDYPVRNGYWGPFFRGIGGLAKNTFYGVKSVTMDPLINLYKTGVQSVESAGKIRLNSVV